VYIIISCVQNISKSYERILTKFYGEVDGPAGRNQLDFGGRDLDSFVESEAGM